MTIMLCDKWWRTEWKFYYWNCRKNVKEFWHFGINELVICIKMFLFQQLHSIITCGYSKTQYFSGCWVIYLPTHGYLYTVCQFVKSKQLRAFASLKSLEITNTFINKNGMNKYTWTGRGYRSITYKISRKRCPRIPRSKCELSVKRI